jgi:hypothetical protein
MFGWVAYCDLSGYICTVGLQFNDFKEVYRVRPVQKIRFLNSRFHSLAAPKAYNPRGVDLYEKN